MKRKIIFGTLLTLLFVFPGQAQIKVTGAGNVGIGNSNPSSKLWVEGTVRFSNWSDLILDWSGYGPTLYPEDDNCGYLGKSTRYLNHIYATTIDYKGGIYHSSDQRLKENILPIGSVLDRIGKIKVYTYNFKDEYYAGYTKEEKAKAQKKECGFIAQEMQEIFPHLVEMSPDSLLRLDYIRMIPLLTQGIKDLSLYADNLAGVVTAQEQELTTLRREMEALRESVSPCREGKDQDVSMDSPAKEHQNLPQDQPVLYQNSPNPFSSKTEISCHLPNPFQQAFLYIYSLQGEELKAYALVRTGDNTVTLHASELPAGMYLYTLVVDQKIIDTKRMILTR